MSAIVDYVKPPNGSFEVGEWDGETIYCFGAYKVRLGDFTYLISHTGSRGTIGAEPLPLDDPEVRAHLIEEAERARDRSDPAICSG